MRKIFSYFKTLSMAYTVCLNELDVFNEISLYMIYCTCRLVIFVFSIQSTEYAKMKLFLIFSFSNKPNIIPHASVF